jgi:hypothetical protein
MLNVSDLCPVIDGQKFSDYLASFVSREILSTKLWDNVFYDNAWEGINWFTAGKADFNIDGIADTDVDSHWRNGYTNLFEATRRLAGDKYLIVGNIGPGHAEYSTTMNGALIESFPEFGWTSAMKAYNAQASNGTKPKVIIINVNTHNTGNKNDFKLMRFGLASTLMGDGYYSFDYGDQDHNQTWWYDEYNVNLGTPVNSAVSFSGQNQFQDNDVWKREYSNGIAIVNPTSQTKDVDLGGDYEKIIGTQDPKVNDGSITDRIKIAPKDGILMLKTFQSVKQAVFKNGSFLRFYRKNGERAKNGFFAFEQGLPGGARVYVGDLNKDGKEEKVVAAQGQLQLLGSDGNALWSDYPYGSNFRGELSIAVGNISQFDTPYIVVSSPTQGSVILYDIIGRKLKEVFPLDKKFKGGFTVAIGNIDNEESGEVIVGVGKGKLSEVIIYDGGLSKIKKRFTPYPKYTGGIEVALGNTQGDSKKEIITMSRASTPVVNTFDMNGKKLSEFKAKTVFGSNKLFLTASDVNNDGVDEIVLMND